MHACMHGRVGSSLMAEGSEGSSDEALDISPLSFELPPDHITAREKKREYLKYHRELSSRIWEGRLRSNAKPTRENEEHPVPEITNHEAPRYRGPEHAEKRKENGAEMDRRDLKLSGNSKRKSEGREMSIEERVKYLLSKYPALLIRLEQEEEAKGRGSSAQSKLNLHHKAVELLRQHWESLPKKYLGHIPGIDVGYHFQSRLMLNMVGMHRSLQAGIDCMGGEETRQGVPLVTSILLAGGYEDNIDNGDVIIYSGHGGNDYERSKKQIKDQELTKGNAALINNYRYEQPVRVIRKYKSNDRELQSFSYDGLYMVEKWWKDKGRSGFLVFKFKLKRKAGQSPLLFNVVQFIRISSKNQVPAIKEDIAEGQDKFPITVVNSVDDVHTIGEFDYVLTVKYPDWLTELAPSEGCRCLEGCTDDNECLCARRNGGKFPYTQDGKLVKSQPVVFECGPSCRCPPSCRNRVSQHGLKHKLEVFRTRRNGWAVRSEDFIVAGEFITEYTGNLIADPTSYASPSEMMFRIASIPMEGNWGDLRGIVKDENVTVLPSRIVENVGFCVDASTSGNASRFISRNSRPNLFAQYVLYDHHDIRIPHVMFFATENISPRLELSINASAQQNQQFYSNARYTGKASSLSQRTKFG